MTPEHLSASSIISEWVHLYANDLYQWALKKTNQEALSEDLVQDTFLAAFQSFERYKAESSPKTYLISILNNKIADYYRKQYREGLNTSNEAIHRGMKQTSLLFNREGTWNNLSYYDYDAHLLDNADFIQRLTSCVATLPAHWQSAVTGKYLLDQSASAICEDLGITASNYWQILHRAKLMLKKCIEFHWFN